LARHFRGEVVVDAFIETVQAGQAQSRGQVHPQLRCLGGNVGLVGQGAG